MFSCGGLGRWAATTVTCVALASAALAVADPTVGPEFGIDEPTTCPEEGGHSSPAIAFDGTNYFAVWTHVPYEYEGVEGDIRGARVTPAGEVLDPWAIAIATGPAHARFPAVAFDGADYLVVWEDFRNAATTSWDVYAARVSPAGDVLDRGGFPVAATAAGEWKPAVTGAAAGGFLVVWQQSAIDGDDVLGARVDVAGAVLDPDGIAISTEVGWQGPPAAASDGAEWFVVWPDVRAGAWSDVYGARVDAAGTVLDPAGIAISTPPDSLQDDVAVAFGGGRYLVAWKDARNWPVTGTDLYGARVLLDGTLEDGPPETGGIPISTGTRWHQGPAVAWGAGSFLVAWERWSNVYGHRVDAGGAVLDPTEIRIATTDYSYEGDPAVASDGIDWLAVWTAGNVLGARVDSAGGVVDAPPFVVSTGSDVEREPAAAFDGTNWLVAWQDWGGAETGRDVHAARVTPAGDILDPVALVISDEYGIDGPPAVAYGDGTYLVAWAGDGTREGCGICGRWVGPDGSPGGWSFLVTVFDGESSDYTFDPAVAFDGTDFLIAWQYCGPSGWSGTCPAEEGRIVGARLSPRGLPTPFTTFDSRLIDFGGYGRGAQHFPVVACGATTCLVVWQRWDGLQWDVLGARVDSDGVVLDPDGISISASATADERRPAVASDGTGWMVAWEDTRADDEDIRAARVGSGGEVLDAAGLDVCTAAGERSAPSVIHDGRRWLVAWRDGAGAGDVRVARVLGSGVVLDPGGVALSATTAAEAAPALASGAAGQVLAAYETDSQGGFARARVRLMTSDCVADPDCDDAVPCTLDTCTFGTCVNAITPEACFIDGACRRDGDEDPANECRSCAPTVSQESWSDDPVDAECDDEDPCTAADRCSSGSCSGTHVPGCGEDAGEDVRADADGGDERDASDAEPVDDGNGDGRADADANDEEGASDGGPADGGDGGAPAVVRLSGGGCGCRVVPADPAPWPVTLLLAWLLVAVGRHATPSSGGSVGAFRGQAGHERVRRPGRGMVVLAGSRVEVGRAGETAGDMYAIRRSYRQVVDPPRDGSRPKQVAGLGEGHQRAPRAVEGDDVDAARPVVRGADHVVIGRRG